MSSADWYGWVDNRNNFRLDVEDFVYPFEACGSSGDHVYRKPDAEHGPNEHFEVAHRCDELPRGQGASNDGRTSEAK